MLSNDQNQPGNLLWLLIELIYYIMLVYIVLFIYLNYWDIFLNTFFPSTSDPPASFPGQPGAQHLKATGREKREEDTVSFPG